MFISVFLYKATEFHFSVALYVPFAGVKDNPEVMYMSS